MIRLQDHFDVQPVTTATFLLKNVTQAAKMRSLRGTGARRLASGLWGVVSGWLTEHGCVGVGRQTAADPRLCVGRARFSWPAGTRWAVAAGSRPG